MSAATLLKKKAQTQKRRRGCVACAGTGRCGFFTTPWGESHPIKCDECGGTGKHTDWIYIKGGKVTA